MTDPTHVPLTPEETSALVQRAVRGGERRLRTRRIASGFAAVAVVAALGVGALSVLTLPGRAPIPASPPVSLSKAPETPTAPIPFDAGIQEGLETLLLDLPGVKAGPEEIADERPGGSYVAGGYLDANTPVTVTLSPVPLRDGDAKQVTSPPLLPEDSTFWELTDAASPDVQVWARERSDGATVTVRVGLGYLPHDEPNTPSIPARIDGVDVLKFLSSDEWGPLLDAVSAAQ
ncbi:MAG TPA: hypothetical protein PKY27_04725 [Arachnia sp.]|jgi:hypothetical protein|nr:hypothetical protein [Propionibacteriaceae bacterium]HOA26210.1 hypothetical protein [Arachnia sp.]HQD21542.1 hypothetical protein [Arachnia sp.]